MPSVLKGLLGLPAPKPKSRTPSLFDEPLEGVTEGPLPGLGGQPRSPRGDTVDGEFRVVPEGGITNKQKLIAAGGIAAGGAGIGLTGGGDDTPDVAGVQKQAAAASQGVTVPELEEQVVTETRSDLEASGATKEDLNVFDKFNKEFDLLTFGLTLMASNDGRQSFSVNLANALRTSRQQKAATESSTAASDRAERKVQVEEKEAEAAQLKAIAEFQKVVLSGVPKGKTPTRTEQVAVQSILSSVFDEKLNADKPVHNQIILAGASVLNAEREQRKSSGIPAMTPVEEAQFLKAWGNQMEVYSAGTVNDTFEVGKLSGAGLSAEDQEIAALEALAAQR